MITSKEWDFSFVVCSNDGSDISQETMDEVMDKFIELIESKNLSLGGTYGPYVDPD